MRQEKKRNTNRRNQTSLFADDIFYVRDPEFSARELEMKHHVIKMTWYTVNLQNSRSCLRTNHKHREGHREQTLFCNNLKKCKYVGINLTQEGKDLYKENFKFLKRELEKDTRKWKDVPCSRIRIIFMNMMALHKGMISFRAMPIKSPILFSTKTEKKKLT